MYSDSVVIALATAIALLDILFILVWVPESLPERMRPASWGAPIPWEKADPFNVSLICFVMVKGFPCLKIRRHLPTYISSALY